MMDDDTIHRTLEALRPRIAPSRSGDPLRTPGCLAYSRLRGLALDPSRATPAEAAHAAGCRRCGHLLRSFARQIPHLSIWTLIRHQVGALRPAEAEQVEYHLVAGPCRSCRERAEGLARSPLALLRLPTPPPLPDLAIARAAVPEPELLARGEEGDLIADLVREGEEVCLEVRTRNPAHLHRLVGYTFGTGGEPRLEGYLVLGRDVEGWYAAHESIDPERLRPESGESEEALEVALLPREGLSAEEWGRVRAAAPGSSADPEAKATWREFCRQQLEAADALSAPAVETLRLLYADLQ